MLPIQSGKNAPDIGAVPYIGRLVYGINNLVPYQIEANLNISIKHDNVFAISLTDLKLKISIDWCLKQLRFPYIKLGPNTAFADISLDYYLEADIGVDPGNEYRKAGLKWSIKKSKPENMEIKF